MLKGTGSDRSSESPTVLPTGVIGPKSQEGPVQLLGLGH